MNGQGMVRWSASRDRVASARGIEARRHGVPSTMIEAATERRAAGDWRGACAAADIDSSSIPIRVRRLHGAASAGALLADLRDAGPGSAPLAPAAPGHGPGRLLEGLFIPLADYGGRGHRLMLAAATPWFALAAGERDRAHPDRGPASGGRGARGSGDARGAATRCTGVPPNATTCGATGCSGTPRAPRVP